ncbi:MAG: tyrA [Nitrospirae bacterium]|nr:tyrA [Nitrospirota bacterium]
MDFNKVTIIGVGLMGGSFALALKEHGFKGRVAGVGRKKDNLIKAKSLGIIDDYSTDPATGVKDADLILLASPPGQFEAIAEDIKGRLKAGAIVTDVGSVKGEIVNRLETLMPEGVSFVGGHPIAGKESSGVDGADATLFKNAKCIITPTGNTDGSALENVVELWETFGCKVSLMTPEEHDMIFAAVSHMPHVLAYVLVNAIMDIKEDVLPYGGSGLKDMTRVALSSAELWGDICSYNREPVLKALKGFSSSLAHTIELIERSDWPSLEKEFKRAKKRRQLLESD